LAKCRKLTQASNHALDIVDALGECKAMVFRPFGAADSIVVGLTPLSDTVKTHDGDGLTCGFKGRHNRRGER
jgi:hypothetical protein